MFERFGRDAQRAVVRALVETRLLGHDAIGTEHLLLALASADGSAASALAAQGVTLDRARAAVAAAAQAAAPSTAWDDGPYTAHAKQAFESAAREALEAQHESVAADHLLLGILRVDDAVGVQALESLGVDLDRLRKEIGETLLTGAPPEPPPGKRPPLGGGASLGIGGHGESDAGSGPESASGDGRASRLACSFCGRELSVGDRFVAGETALICASCVRACARIVDEPV
jgi:hypothetical protein